MNQPARFTPSRSLLCALALAASVASTPSRADRPLTTEDASILDLKECELDSFVARNPDARTTARWVQFGCGIGFGTQLALAGERTRSDGVRESATALVGKTALRPLGTDDYGVTLAYSFGGSRHTGQGFKIEDSDIRAVLTLPQHGWLFHANLGWAREHASSRDSTVWGLAAERRHALGPFDLMAEIYGDDRGAPWLQTGARWRLIPDRLHLDAAVGVRTGGTRSKLGSIGLKLAF